jgi:hypothetical protein
MAFDANNTAHLTTLRDYGNSLGFGGSTQSILDAVNLPENNPTTTNGPDRMTATALLFAIFDVAISSQDQFKVQLLFEATEGRSGDLSDFREKVKNLSTALSSAVDGIVRALSWAEVTFGTLDVNGVYERVVISRNDWFAARDYIGV